MSEKKHCMVIVHDLVFLNIFEYQYVQCTYVVCTMYMCVHERRQHQPQDIFSLNDENFNNRNLGRRILELRHSPYRGAKK